MKILAIDTATESCSAALYLDGEIIARELEFERGHAEHILPMVEEVLAAASVLPGELDALAFGRGPGGFTGVRLAASVVQGLAFAWGRVVVPVSDLAAVAQRALDLDGGGRVVVCNDARMHEVYWGCFERGAGGLAVLVGLERVGPPLSVELPAAWEWAVAGTRGAGVVVGDKAGGGVKAAMANSGRKLVGGGNVGDQAVAGGGDGEKADRGAVGGVVAVGASIVGVGRGFGAYPELVTHLEGRVRMLDDRLLPRAREITRLAAEEVQAGRVVTAEEAIPVYLRDNVAQPQSRN